MSKLGYIQKSYGTNLEFGIANTYGYNILSGSNLPVNSIIIASPVDENNNDLGSYTLLATDYTGNPVRLTYTIKEGNGIEYSDDSIKVKIDNNTIIEKEKVLTANIESLIDNHTVIYDKNEISLNVDNLNKANQNTAGIFKIDNNTLKISDNVLFADTSTLNYSNPNNDVAGTVIGDNNIITVNQGKITLNQDKLTKADNDKYGVVIGTKGAVTVEEGIISIDTESLSFCTEETPGIVSVDNESIYINNDDELTVETEKLDKVTPSSFGVFKYDNNTFEMNEGTLKIKNYDNFNEFISSLKTKEDKLQKQITDIDYLFEEYKVGLNKPEIYDFHCCDLLTSVLQKPIFLNQTADQMNTQFISVDFSISTNCPFSISIKYENNVDPAVQLYAINYDNILDLRGAAGLLEIYQTTQGKNIPLRFTFIAKNYFNNNRKEFSKTTKINITVSYINDMSINKSIMYSITRFNSGYNEEIIYDVVNIEKANVAKGKIKYSKKSLK